MKHIYILDDNYNGTVFGIGTYIRNLTAVLKDSALLITVIKLSSEEDHVKVIRQEGIRYIHIPSVRTHLKCKNYYRNVFYVLCSYINSSEENILHLNYRKGSDLVLLLKQHFQFKIILAWHFASWIEFFRQKQAVDVLKKIQCKELLSEKEDTFATIFKEEKRILAQYVDHVVCVAHHTTVLLKKYYELPNKKISIVYNALPIYPFKFIDKKNIRKQLHIPVYEKVILCVGRLDENKNQIAATLCFDKILSKNNHTSLWIIGHGNYDESLRYGYPNSRAIVYTGFLDQEKLHTLYEIADIGIIPSRYEEFGYVAVEMMMHGIPIIANRTSGLAEIIEDGVSGDLLDLYDDKTEEETTDLLATAINNLLSNLEKQKRYTKNAYQRYLDNFGMDSFKKKMLDIYNKI